ncbi:MAG TPA: multicopper oxidase family protein [Bryobacteraceae bacterium]|nr:multicopper oxidase family protein [Bryobacteraceae bacterium]
MTRRDMLSIASGCISAMTVRADVPADITLRISELTLEVSPRRFIKTTGYNGQAPGPLLRMQEGKSVIVDVVNETKEHEMVHWHGFHIPPEVDGAHEEGTPPVMAGEQRRYVFTPSPSGTRWYHSHGPAGRNLRKTTYSGQFGMVVVNPASDPARYDLEVPVLLHEWEPYFDQDMDVAYKLFSINGKMLGAGEPISVHRGQRVLFRILNASATMTHRLALAGHQFRVVALDGNTVPSPQPVPVVELAPAERVDAIVTMDRPGIWVLGETRNAQRNAGMGIVVEYTDQHGPPKWAYPEQFVWDYTLFGGSEQHSKPDRNFPLTIRAGNGNKWTVNGKAFPHTAPLIVSANQRYRIAFDNQSSEAHPMHVHRHNFEINRFADKATSGVFKDTVVVPAWRTVEVDLIASHPGATLIHCHQQYHMDFGLMLMMQYAG